MGASSSCSSSSAIACRDELRGTTRQVGVTLNSTEAKLLPGIATNVLCIIALVSVQCSMCRVDNCNVHILVDVFHQVTAPIVRSFSKSVVWVKLVSAQAELIQV